MDIGIGFSETLLVLLLILVFFGSKQMPSLLREMGKITATIRIKVQEVLTEIQKSTQPSNDYTDEATEKKAELRKRYNALRKQILASEVRSRSEKVNANLVQDNLWKQAKSMMLYLSLPFEVQTDAIITQAFGQGKRVVVPYLANKNRDIQISEITSLQGLEKGPFWIRQPSTSQIKRFFKSDLDLIICPGVAFDRMGGRLGFGKGYYDSFLRELRGKVPIVGLAFDLQVLQKSLPFSYHDVPVDMVFTETETIRISEQ